MMKGFIVGLLLAMAATTLLCGVVKCEPNKNLVNKIICNGNPYQSGDLFGDNAVYVLFDLTNVTPSRQGFDYHTVSPATTAVAYGHANCNTLLNNNDCADCLESAHSALWGECTGRIGGQIQLVDCTMRFENYSF